MAEHLDPVDQRTFGDEATPEQVAHWEEARNQLTEITRGVWMSGITDRFQEDVLELKPLLVISLTVRDPKLVIHGTAVHRMPFPDGASLPSRYRLRKLGCQAAEVVRRGEKVLVHCAYGLNRSGLVVAYVLRELLGLHGEKLLSAIQQRRPGALFNPVFADHVRNLGEVGPREGSDAVRSFVDSLLEQRKPWWEDPAARAGYKLTDAHKKWFDEFMAKGGYDAGGHTAIQFASGTNAADTEWQIRDYKLRLQNSWGAFASGSNAILGQRWYQAGFDPSPGSSDESG